MHMTSSKIIKVTHLTGWLLLTAGCKSVTFRAELGWGRWAYWLRANYFDRPTPPGRTKWDRKKKINKILRL